MCKCVFVCVCVCVSLLRLVYTFVCTSCFNSFLYTVVSICYGNKEYWSPRETIQVLVVLFPPPKSLGLQCWF